MILQRIHVGGKARVCLLNLDQSFLLINSLQGTIRFGTHKRGLKNCRIFAIRQNRKLNGRHIIAWIPTWNEIRFLGSYFFSHESAFPKLSSFSIGTSSLYCLLCPIHSAPSLFLQKILSCTLFLRQCLRSIWTYSIALEGP
jgi:hypothetical protein